MDEKYKLKNLCDITKQERYEIYKYAIKCSNNLIYGENKMQIIVCDKCGVQNKTTEKRAFHIDNEECYDGVDAVYTSYDLCDKCYIALFEFFLDTYDRELADVSVVFAIQSIWATIQIP